VAAGTATAAQVKGDCMVKQCDGQGGVTNAVDDTDLPDDNNPCTKDTCNGGTPTFTNVTAGTSCGGSLVCDGQGKCVGCVTATDCPGTDTTCHSRTCTAGTCGTSNAAAGTALPAALQTAGDCQVKQCDGSGNVTSAADDTDVPVDGKTCTLDVCTNGVPSNPPVATGTPCTDSGGVVCDAGVCVQCVVATDCPGQDTACATRTCVAGVCGVSDALPGTVAGPQTAGDCQVNECDGSGNLVAMVDDTDVPVDGKACTLDVCTNGVPSNPAVTMGTTCAQGGTVCDGAGNCVQCNTSADCPGKDTACETRTCTAGVCGKDDAALGTALPPSQQTPGDCKIKQCDGAGNITSVADDSDLPVDGNDCTGDVCNGGTPSNPGVAEGTACTQNAGEVCDTKGTCNRLLAYVVLGDGQNPLTNAATQVSIAYVYADGTTTSRATTDVSAATFTLSGTATSEGSLTRAVQGQFVVMAGYSTTLGTAAVASTTSAAVNRAVARVSASGGVDASTRLAASFNKNNPRG
jgi:hypothetical protein